jgi:APA family basic amino acid/polyamine antiporter
MANLSEEMRNPERDLPKAMMLALGISTIFYMLVAVSAASVLGWQELGQSSAPLATVAARLLGGKADLLLTIIALASTANTVLLLLFASSRAMWAMSCAGVLPAAFCTIGERRRTPWIAIMVVGTIATGFAFVRSIESVAEFTNFATLLAFAGVNASAVKIFSRKRNAGRVKHALVDIVLPALGLGSSVWLAANTGWRAAVFGAGLLAAGIAVYFLLRRLSASRKGKSEQASPGG